MIEQLILVRHGETLHNVNGLAQGWQDSPLSELGQQQVARLARRVGELGPDALYSSPLMRAVTTAEAIRGVTGLDIQLLDGLREMNYGGWEGRSFLDVRRLDQETFRQWTSDPSFPSPGGESHNQVLERVKAAIESVTGAKRPVLVSHGTAIRIATTSLLDAPLSLLKRLAVDNASISIFEWRGDRCVLKLWNDTTHCRTE